MLTAIVQIMIAVGALAGLATAIYTGWLSPKAKARRQAKKDGQKAARAGNPTGVTRFFDRIRRRKRRE